MCLQVKLRESTNVLKAIETAEASAPAKHFLRGLISQNETMLAIEAKDAQ